MAYVAQYDQKLLYGAARIALVRLQEALRKIGSVFGQVFGQAEGAHDHQLPGPHDHDLSRPQSLRSCGEVIAGNQVALLDRDLRGR